MRPLQTPNRNQKRKRKKKNMKPNVMVRFGISQNATPSDEHVTQLASTQTSQEIHNK